MHRLFVGIYPPPPIRAQLLMMMGGVENARWQDAGQLHCTLRFIGEVTRPVAEDIAAALNMVRAAPLTIALDGIGQFDRRGRPTALWAGIAPAAPVAALHRKIDHALVRCGLTPESRAYLPHFTLARCNARTGPTRRFCIDHAACSSPPATVGHFLLFESTLSHDGARYEAIARYPLDLAAAGS